MKRSALVTLSLVNLGMIAVMAGFLEAVGILSAEHAITGMQILIGLHIIVTYALSLSAKGSDTVKVWAYETIRSLID